MTKTYRKADGQTEDNINYKLHDIATNLWVYSKVQKNGTTTSFHITQ